MFLTFSTGHERTKNESPAAAKWRSQGFRYTHQSSSMPRRIAAGHVFLYDLHDLPVYILHRAHSAAPGALDSDPAQALGAVERSFAGAGHVGLVGLVYVLPAGVAVVALQKQLFRDGGLCL